MKWKILILTGVLFSFFSGQANAVTVTNLDTVAHNLRVQYIGGDMETIQLPPNGIFRYQGAGIWIAVGDREALHALDNNDYVIWPGGKLRIQKYRKYDKDRR